MERAWEVATAALAPRTNLKASSLREAIGTVFHSRFYPIFHFLTIRVVASLAVLREEETLARLLVEWYWGTQPLPLPRFSQRVNISGCRAAVGTQHSRAWFYSIHYGRWHSELRGSFSYSRPTSCSLLTHHYRQEAKRTFGKDKLDEWAEARLVEVVDHVKHQQDVNTVIELLQTELGLSDAYAPLHHSCGACRVLAHTSSRP